MDRDALIAEIARLHGVMRTCADSLDGGEEFREPVAARLRNVAEASRINLAVADFGVFAAECHDRINAAFTAFAGAVAKAAPYETEIASR